MIVRVLVPVTVHEDGAWSAARPAAPIGKRFEFRGLTWDQGATSAVFELRDDEIPRDYGQLRTIEGVARTVA